MSDEPPPPKRISVEHYQYLVEAGVLTSEVRVELLEGWIVQKRPLSPAGASTLGRCALRFRELLPSAWHCRLRSSLVTPDSVPEPDVAVVPGAPDRYDERHPTAAGVTVTANVPPLTFMTNLRS
jgi:hypothetical protein